MDAMNAQLQRDVETLNAEAFAVSLLPIVGSKLDKLAIAHGHLHCTCFVDHNVQHCFQE
jgi:hypothetical protein